LLMLPTGHIRNSLMQPGKPIWDY